MILAVDFDGCCVEDIYGNPPTDRPYNDSDYPGLGNDVVGAMGALRILVNRGHQLILFTNRTNNALTDAIDWFYKNGISLLGVNINPNQILYHDHYKIHFDRLVDDKAIGCPLMKEYGKKPYVDWGQVFKSLEEEGW